MVSWFHLHPNLTNSLNQIVECELSGFSAHAVASSPDPHRRHSQDWWRAESSALWAAPGLWRCCRNERYNQNLWCTQCNRGRCVQDVRRHSWGTTAGSFQSAPSFWSGTTFYSRRLQTTPEVMKTKRRRMRQIWKCFQQMLVEIELTRHLTFMPSMYFFSGFLRTMSERWFRGTRPLMWSVRCTTIPWFNRTDTLPWKKNMSKERSDMKDSRNSPLQGQCHVYTYTYMCVYENNTHMHNICLTSTTWPALMSWYLKKGFSMILLGRKKNKKQNLSCYVWRTLLLSNWSEKNMKTRTYLRRLTKWIWSMRLKSRILQVCSDIACNLFSLAGSCNSFRWFLCPSPPKIHQF